MEQGTVFGKYHIRRQIGRGGMGIVYLAEDTTLMRLIALKVLDRTVTSNPQFEQRFLQEARTVASLNHPNIVPIYAMSRIDENWAIEMPFIEGGSLMEAEERGTLDLRRTLKIMRDILLALAVCHEADIIHRDVKPSNILLDEQGRGMLSDFGLAKLLSLHQRESVQSSCSSSLFIGTPRYAPPESWESQEATPAWDVYSTGMVLYEAIAGKVPYDAQTPLSLMKQMLEQPIPPLKEIVPAISESLSALVGDMLAADPAERPQDVADVLEQFWALPEFSGDRSSPPVLVRPLKRKPHKKYGIGLFTAARKKLFGVVSVLLLAAVLGLAGIFTLFRDMPAEVSSRALDTSTPAVSPALSGLVAFDMVDMATQDTTSGFCISRVDAAEQPWSLLAAGPLHLWFMTVHPQPDDLVTIDGYWADYDRAVAMVFRHGTFSGKGRWVRRNQDLSVVLSFIHPESTAQWERPVLFRRDAAVPVGKSFLCSLEMTDALPSLVYNELLPRNLPWRRQLSEFFTDLGLAFVDVPRYAEDTNEIVVDGRLQEAAWRISLGDGGNAPGSVSPEFGPDGSMMRVWRDDEALYIGVHIAAVIGQPRILLALQTAHAIPSASAARWMVQADNGKLVASRVMRAGNTLPWDCDWEIAGHEEADMLEMEIRIPYAGLRKTFLPGARERWLLNCHVGEARPDGMTTVAQWGHETIENTACGLLLAFD